MSLIGTRLEKHNRQKRDRKAALVYRGLGNQSGQAALEYILMLCITVFIIGTTIYQFSSAFRVYAKNYFGDYVACLIETGELPGQTAAGCQDLWKPYNFTDGKTSTGGQTDLTGGGAGGSGGIGSGSGGNKSNSDGSGNTSKNNSGNTKSSSNSSSSSSSSSASSGSPTGASDTGASASSGGVPSGSRFGANRTKSIGNANQDAGNGREGLKAVGSTSSFNSSNDSSGRSRRKALDRSFGFAGEKEKEERDLGRPTTKKIGEDDSSRLKPRKTAEAAARAPAATNPDANTGMSFGSFLRILLIAAILIAIFVVFGGQLLAISKGGEK